MTAVQKWHDVVMNVQNANLEQQNVQKNIKKLNKIMYKKQLDRQVQQKNYCSYLKNQMKAKQRKQAQMLAQAEKIGKLKQKLIKQEIQKQYGNDNLNLLDFQKKVRTASTQLQRTNIKQYLQHPFVKLVDQQESRKLQSRKKFINQNYINQIQEKIKNKIKDDKKYQETQEKNNFINYVESNHEKRSQERQKFKNKYLRLKKGEIGESSLQQNSSNMSVQQNYVSYLNNQITNDRFKRLKEKYQYIDDSRISKFYQKNTDPDSSPAYLGRNPLSYQRKRQLYYIHKHLNTNHQQQNQSKSLIKSGNNPYSSNQQRQKKNLDSYLREYEMNPQTSIIRNPHHHQNKTESVQPLAYYGSNMYSPSKQPITQRKNQVKFFNQQIDRKMLNNTTVQVDKFLQFQNRRIKSQFSQDRYNSNFTLPNVHNKNQRVPNSYSTDMALSQKKEYKRYDFISGKEVSYFA